MIGWLIREAGRSSLDALGTALDSAASALHRAAGEPDRVTELEAERAVAVAEAETSRRQFGKMRAVAKSLMRKLDEARADRDDADADADMWSSRTKELERALVELDDYAVAVAGFTKGPGVVHMPTRIREALDRLRTRGDRMRDAARRATARLRDLRIELAEAQRDRDDWRTECERLERSEKREAELRSKFETLERCERMRAGDLQRERDEARKDVDYWRNLKDRCCFEGCSSPVSDRYCAEHDQELMRWRGRWVEEHDDYMNLAAELGQAEADGDGGWVRFEGPTACVNAARQLKTELAEARAECERLRAGLAASERALRLWGSEGDGVPADGPIGEAFDTARTLLGLAPVNPDQGGAG